MFLLNSCLEKYFVQWTGGQRWTNGYVMQIAMRDVPVEVEKVGACMCI